ncbi:hypothetical protein [Sphingomonas jatrophae]|uniref:Uncharacterized protein n=1 Tax=Sphingomonas jatrophae TaxID=1166337 RepID=A0A1I6LRI4_9SPHN|nr:hypothetical protein [Sphingomonas jatrophae]SFS06107.1 hypothetical protein SAMN05192580_3179 [Sphingomonas jatrophae]
MLEAVAVTYTFIASFVLASAERNRRQQRPHARQLEFFGRLLMALSLTLSVLLGGWAAWSRLIG